MASQARDEQREAAGFLPDGGKAPRGGTASRAWLVFLYSTAEAKSAEEKQLLSPWAKARDFLDISSPYPHTLVKITRTANLSRQSSLQDQLLVWLETPKDS